MLKLIARVMGYNNEKNNKYNNNNNNTSLNNLKNYPKSKTILYPRWGPWLTRPCEHEQIYRWSNQ